MTDDYFLCDGVQQHGRGVHLMTARLLRLLLRLPRSSAATRATDHDTSNRALFKYCDAVYVILATYIDARYKAYTSILIHLESMHHNSYKVLKISLSRNIVALGYIEKIVNVLVLVL